MSDNFGDFIKEKRARCNYSLKYVAEIIGISNVYQSSIEAGKRPAPSYDVLMKLRDALKLNDDEFGEMLDLAAESKNSRAVAYDLADYINQNDFTINLYIKIDYLLIISQMPLKPYVSRLFGISCFGRCS